MPSISFKQQTDDDFYKARNKALVNEIQHFLNPEEASLIALSDLKKILKPHNETYKGMQAVPVSLIVGSEGRYKDFDNQFFPKNAHLKARWESIDRAHLQNVILPPVTLYELGGLYFARDGNHRISVAKARGIEFIDAEVVSLKSEIKLKPGTSMKSLLKQIINYEKRVFYSETNFGDITDYWCLDFTTAGQYDVIYNHILTHKYYMNMNQEEEISMQDAILSWFEKVYMPVIQVINNARIMGKFHHRTISDLYVWMIKYWDDLKKKFGEDYPIDLMAQDFKKTYGTGFFHRISNFVSKKLLKRNIDDGKTIS
ncbi:MAG: transcriptional regulator [Treponema sp.]|uniref:transcriptional regulator n=1 Tax=Treponema sp. TaxID=166 RepID=UPI001B42104A|nr:transcriptional regulator [Treponema sp.]MBP5403109.1 transcriptional regulator [Treponema sp.]MBR5934328.1 transcriptional regulator [Treponema sp.]